MSVAGTHVGTRVPTIASCFFPVFSEFVPPVILLGDQTLWKLARYAVSMEMRKIL